MAFALHVLCLCLALLLPPCFKTLTTGGQAFKVDFLEDDQVACDRIKRYGTSYNGVYVMGATALQPSGVNTDYPGPKALNAALERSKCDLTEAFRLVL